MVTAADHVRINAADHVRINAADHVRINAADHVTINAADHVRINAADHVTINAAATIAPPKPNVCALDGYEAQTSIIRGANIPPAKSPTAFTNKTAQYKYDTSRAHSTSLGIGRSNTLKLSH